MKRLINLAFALALTSTSGIAQTAKRAAPVANPQTELARVERELFAAVANRDSAKLNLLVAADFKEVDNNGRLLDRLRSDGDEFVCAFDLRQERKSAV